MSITEITARELQTNVGHCAGIAYSNIYGPEGLGLN